MPLKIPLPSLRRDPVFAGALALLVCALIPAFSALADGGGGGAPIARALAIAAAFVAATFHRPQESGRTRTFWRLISVGFAFFFATQLWQLEAGALFPPTLARREDLLYLARYLFLVMAMEIRPDSPRPGKSDEQLRLLDTVGAVLFLFAIIAYVLLSPPFHEGASPAQSLPLRALYILLDVFLVARVLTLRMQAQTAYWRSAYGWFVIVFTLRAINNLVTGSPGGGEAALGGGSSVGPLWLTLFFPLLIVARLQSDGVEEPAVVDGSTAARTRLAPLVGYAFAFPVFHFLMERLGIVAHEMAGPREMVVLGFLGAAAILLWIHQRVLFRENDRLEAERRIMLEEAAEARRVEGLGRLAGGVAHDFNNLLTVIRGRTELLLAEQTSSPEMREDLEAIRQAARKGEGVTRQLLAFGRKQMLRPQVLDLGAVVREMAPLLRSAVSAEVEVSVAVRDPAPFIVADQGQVEMALLNLAVNAREAMPGGGLLAIEIDRAELDSDAVADIPGAEEGSYVLLSARDTGHGMDAATLRRIFDPFFTTKPFGSGAGLGLPAVHGFVKQSGGAMKVASEPGRGATFQIYLPRVDPLPPKDGAQLPASSG